MCAVAWAKTDEAKKHVRKIRRQAYRKDKAEFRLKDIPHQLNLTRDAFNKMRVLEELKWFRDRGLKPHCISCQKTDMDWCCGHLKTVGAQSGLRYDRRNTYLQCNRRCNMALSGNVEGNKTTIGYRRGIIDRFGEEEGGEILEYCDTHTSPVKWTADQLVHMRAGFRRASRQLAKELQESE